MVLDKGINLSDFPAWKMSLEVTMMEKMKIEWHRVAAFVSALALILLWVLPVAVTPAQAAVLDCIDAEKIDVTEFLDPDIAPFASNRMMFRPYFALDKFPSVPYSNIYQVSDYSNTYTTGSPVTVVGSGSKYTFYCFSFLDNYSNSLNMLEINSVIDISSYVSAGYIYGSIMLDMDCFDSSLEKSLTAQLVFFKEDGSYLSGKTINMRSYSTDPIYASEIGLDFEIPSGAAYFYPYFYISFKPFSGSVQVYSYHGYNDTHFVLHTGNKDPVFPTDPTEPSSPSGGSSGGSSGSDGTVNFDDSGIIDSVTSSADRIIDSVTNALGVQSVQITEAISSQSASFNNAINSQTNQIKDGMDDLNDNLDDVNDNLGTLIGTGDEGDALESASDSFSDINDEVFAFEESVQSTFDEHIGVVDGLITFTKWTSSLAFIQHCLNLAFDSLGDYSIIYYFPIFLGVFFYICGHMPGSTRWRDEIPPSYSRSSSSTELQSVSSRSLVRK